MSRGSKLRWLWRAPARALGRARDMYVRGLTGCARYVPADAGFGYPVFVPAPLSRSHSADWRGGAGSGADEDLRELVRAASQRRVEQRRAELQAVARSQSMAASLSMARIDEDAPCEFGADAGDGPGALYPRSQSCVGDAAGRRAHAHRRHGKVVALV
ncbi:hypothetical protein BDA96_01G079100 [Sorghum bicolor]|uniref:Uncharacterized protein n=2 Tax=Sorghum bicolor TaxID=4558 RepID=A0A921RVR4_SORBI|nr:uncharacterized protein LOC8084189 [Sorghum bicolor]EER93386.1 hypothetical protein SORBI_3001G076100 [Sorghum bicolor]KAG0547424.1 hypothetical protein BDA96_01G079100 [Sorghum bicolor]|eukprot:XP_002466388.1 uncharacterized protein LOC8084189 [Sorghum bicolor]